MKKILLISIPLFILSLAAHAYAQGFVPLAPIPGLTDISPTAAIDANTLASFFNNLYKFAIGIAATLAVIEIIWGGLNISTQDSVSKKEEGKERIQNAIFGLVLVLSPVLVFSLINPNILNLSLNLPPINLTTAPGQVATSTPTLGNVQNGLQPTSSNVMTTTYISCTSSSCLNEKNTCLAGTNAMNSGQADPVCLKSDGTVDSNGQTNSWYQSGYVCVAGETLSIQCTRFTAK